jgi:hypothetical protein
MYNELYLYTFFDLKNYFFYKKNNKNNAESNYILIGN